MTLRGILLFAGVALAACRTHTAPALPSVDVSRSKLGQFEDARPHFEAVLRLEPGFKPAMDAIAAIDAQKREKPQ